MKKKLLTVLCVLLALILLATAVGPHIVLAAVRQPVPAETYAYSDSFYTSYEDIRAHLQELTAQLGVEISSYAIDEADDLYIDSFYLPSTGDKANLVVLTTGVTVWKASSAPSCWMFSSRKFTPLWTPKTPTFWWLPT